MRPISRSILAIFFINFLASKSKKKTYSVFKRNQGRDIKTEKKTREIATLKCFSDPTHAASLAPCYEC
jgi:hypothetical protein